MSKEKTSGIYFKTSSNDLNQIARHINSSGGYYPDEIEEIKAALNENLSLFGSIMERLSKIT